MTRVAAALAFGLASLALVAPSAAAGGIRASAPEEVHVDRFIPVTGTVRVVDRHRRPVRLQERVGGRWHVMVRGRSTRDGAFRLTMRSGPIPQVRTLRVVAPPRRGLPRARTRPFDVRIYVNVGAEAR